MARHKNACWTLHDPVQTWDECILAVLMDIRDELKLVRGDTAASANVMRCTNFLAIPRVLQEIRRNTAKRRRKTNAR